MTPTLNPFVDLEWASAVGDALWYPGTEFILLSLTLHEVIDLGSDSTGRRPSI